MKENLSKLKRKELLRIARIYGIKNRNKMKKEELIKAIKKVKKPLEALRELEEKLKKSINERTGEEHLIVIPKEPGYVFVNWEAKERTNGILKFYEDKIEKFSLPVNIEYGKSYIKVEEDKKVKAEIYIEHEGSLKKILESNEILTPTSKKTEGNIEFKDIRTLQKAKGGKTKSEEIQKTIEQEEKTAKEIKYLRYGREGK